MTSTIGTRRVHSKKLIDRRGLQIAVVALARRLVGVMWGCGATARCTMPSIYDDTTSVAQDSGGQGRLTWNLRPERDS